MKKGKAWTRVRDVVFRKQSASAGGWRGLERTSPLALYSRKELRMKKEKLERDFQASLIKELKQRFDGCIIAKLDASYIQGIPDLLILWRDKWATLECKKNARARHRPNQDYYVQKMNEMSFSRFIFPENRKETIDELVQSFESGRNTRIPRSK